MAESQNQHRVVIVGAGYAGSSAARELARLAGGTTEIIVTAGGVNRLLPIPGITDYAHAIRTTNRQHGSDHDDDRTHHR